MTGALHPGASGWAMATECSLRRIREAAAHARQHGDVRALTTSVASHFDDTEVKAAAIATLCRRKRWVRVPEPLQIARQLNLRSLGRSMRTGRLSCLRKPNGGTRLVCSLSWPLRVAQLLAHDVLLNAHEPADHIGDWCGRGPSHHIGRVLEDLQHGTIVLIADVIDCFQSVRPDAVYQLGLLPSDVVEACFDARRIRLRVPRNGCGSSIGYTFERTGRSGLLSGGSASSLMWAMLIDDLAGALPAGVRAHTYVDNIIIVCRTTQECDDAEAALIRYFTEHLAGPFFLRTARADAEAGFDHLGYRAFVFHGVTFVGLKNSRLPQFEARTEERVAAVEGDIGDAEFERIVNELLSPWPMLCASSREALIAEISYECDRHNSALRCRPV